VPLSLEELRDQNHQWGDYTSELLKTLFTSDELSTQFLGFGIGGDYDRDPRRHHQNIRRSLESSLARLRSIHGKIELYDEAPQASAEFHLDFTKTQPRQSRDVFVVHGRDEGVKLSVAAFLNRLGLNPIILHDQPDQGRTVIEKFEDHSATSGFAVVLLTPDDTGGLVGGQAELRARQNVVFELGYFIGKLGRSHVCALKADDVEEPSDLRGILYVPLDAAGAWRFTLARELKAAGIEVDLNKAI
jgi:predicted nucleotide-binding protein